MIIVKIAGGLGNQMYNYAFAKFLQQNGCDVLLDASWFIKNEVQLDSGGGEISIRKFELKNYTLSIPYFIHRNVSHFLKFAYPTSYIIFYFLYRATPKPLRPLIFLKKYTPLKEDCDVASIIAQKDTLILCDGYFFKYEYVKSVWAELLEDFKLQTPINAHNQEWYKCISNVPNSVFLHIRRGDYFQAKNTSFIKLGVNYYEGALRVIKQSLSNAHIFIFSNDITWCKNTFLNELSTQIKQGLQFSFVEGNDEGSATEEMELMSACNHAIIANSTFSWWAAYRIKNPTKIVIAPDRITTHWTIEQAREFYPPEWILLDCEKGNKI